MHFPISSKYSVNFLVGKISNLCSEHPFAFRLVKIRPEFPTKKFLTTHIIHRTFILILLPRFFIYQFNHKFAI